MIERGKLMNITFFIGNGFDLNLGLKTSYSNFYKYFVRKADEKNIIRKWINGNEQLWSDLEESLGKALVRLENGQVEKFYQDKEELDLLLLEYLEKEQKNFKCDEINIIKREMIRSILNFNTGLSKKDSASIQSTLDTYKNETYTYRFISFNYTNCLDRILKTINNSMISSHLGSTGARQENVLESVIHIHGTINEEMILGVNDESQIENNMLKSNKDFLDIFIKPRINDNIGQQKNEAVKKVIINSHIICVFGMSLGNTDKIWWEELINWLCCSTHNKLIIYWKGYEEVLKKKLPMRTIRLNNQIKKEIFDKGKGEHEDKEFNQIKDRIILSFNAEIFKFSKCVS